MQNAPIAMHTAFRLAMHVQLVSPQTELAAKALAALRTRHFHRLVRFHVLAVTVLAVVGAPAFGALEGAWKGDEGEGNIPLRRLDSTISKGGGWEKRKKMFDHRKEGPAKRF